MTYYTNDFCNYIVCFRYFTVVVSSVGFSQSSYRVNEGARDGSIKLTVVLDRPVGCNCYTSVSVITNEMTATSKFL